ncbi:aspartic proteinase [Trifolium repens]|nr:aspartic proteinase [Trifolium repens]
MNNVTPERCMSSRSLSIPGPTSIPTGMRKLYYTKVKLGTPPVDFTSRLTPTMIFSGLVAALALVVHKQVFCRLSSNILTLYIHQHRPQSPVQTKGATLKLVTVRTISVLTISNMERWVKHMLEHRAITCQTEFISTLSSKDFY